VLSVSIDERGKKGQELLELASEKVERTTYRAEKTIGVEGVGSGDRVTTRQNSKRKGNDRGRTFHAARRKRKNIRFRRGRKEKERTPRGR